MTLRLRDRHVFHDTTWRIRRGEHWAVVGPNGSGKTTLVRVLTGHTPVVAGRVQRCQGELRVGYVSPELYRGLMTAELARDHSRYAAGRPDGVALAGSLLPRPQGRQAGRIVDALAVTPLLDRPLRHLSSGETKRILLARALGTPADLLVLDEPYDGLDAAGRHAFDAALSALVDGGPTVVLISHRPEEVPPAFRRALLVSECRVVAAGDRECVLTRAFARAATECSAPATRRRTAVPSGSPVVQLRNVTVGYDGVTVLDRLSWTMHAGENWCILGPNGSGKTTLLDLIYGDNQQAYANDVTVLGRRRGDGRSLWELRRPMGIVTPRLQTRFRRPLPVQEVIAGGLFDSIGLFRRPSEEDWKEVSETALRLGLEEFLPRRFDLLSAGERMLVLIARALVKRPALLILDEPCQGLDTQNRRRVLDTVDAAGSGRGTDLLYVTHHEDEIPGCMTHTLRLPGGRTSRRR